MCLNPTILVHPQVSRLYHLKKFDSFYFDGIEGRLSHLSFGFKHWFYEGVTNTRFDDNKEITRYEKFKDRLLDLDKYFYFYHSETGETFPMFFVAPCNKCRDCLRSRYTEYASRLTLEALSQDYPPIFFTLTYDNDHLPEGGSVSKSDISCFIKRMQTYLPRYGFKDSVPRFFICSEYGPLHGRPHYHGLLFGVDLSSIEDFFTFGDVLHASWDKCDPRNCPYEMARSNVGCAKYVTKYIIKGLKDKNIPDGCLPNFISTPRRVGLGLPALLNPTVVRAILSSTDGTITLPSVSRYARTAITYNRFSIPKYIINKLFPCVSKTITSNVKRHIQWMIESFNAINNHYSVLDRPLYYRILGILGVPLDNSDPYFRVSGDRLSVATCSRAVYFNIFNMCLKYLSSLVSEFCFIEITEQARNSFKQPISRSRLQYLRDHPKDLSSINFISDCMRVSLHDCSLNL